MTGEGPPDLVDFDADAVLAAVREAVGEAAVLICSVYDEVDFRTVYVDERVDALYEDEAAREEHFRQFHSYVHLDFFEGELFEEMIIDPDGVRAFVTYMGNLVVARVVHDGQGVFLALAPDAPVTETVEAVQDELRR